ncbi:uncharacterized protein LOC130715262 [Lotus japonicus]|uniref:uncharacterized protein LOC130715262 n=1 Tax=Lotus japonicus TaxID=34305 RepID=UPI00258E83D2|nr:uncharacterized protein LOC130715262 [Lotus japonicus]
MSRSKKSANKRAPSLDSYVSEDDEDYDKSKFMSFSAQLEYGPISEKRVTPERVVQLKDHEFKVFQDQINRRGWKKVAEPHPSYHPDTVYQFYANASHSLDAIRQRERRAYIPDDDTIETITGPYITTHCSPKPLTEVLKKLRDQNRIPKESALEPESPPALSDREMLLQMQAQLDRQNQQQKACYTAITGFYQSFSEHLWLTP